MAEELSIIIGADVEDAKAGIKSVTDVLNDFGRQGKLSIAAVERSMVELRQTIKTTSDPTEVAKLKQAYSELGLKLQQLKISGGLESQLNGVSRSTRIAHSELDGIALSLRGVATGSERGVDALSNIAFRFEQLRGETGGVKAALAALGESFLGPAGLVLGLTTVIALLGPFIEKLFSAEDAEKANKKALDDLSGSIKQVKEDSDNLTTSLNFLNKLGSINVKIFGQGNLEDLRQQSVANQQLIVGLAEETNRALKNLQDAQLQNQKQNTKESQKVLDEAVQGVKDAQKKEAEARDNGRILFRQIELQKVEDQKAVNKKLEEELKKQNEIIRKANEEIINNAKDIQSSLSGKFRLDFKILDTDALGVQLSKAKQTIKDFISGKFDVGVISITPEIELPGLRAKTQEGIDKAIIEGGDFHAKLRIALEAQTGGEAELDRQLKLLQDRLKTHGQTFEQQLSIHLEIGDLEKQAGKVAGTLGGISEQAVIAGTVINDTLTPAFQSLFKAIEAGKNPLEAFFKSIGVAIDQLIQKLIAAAIEALILSAILPGGGGGFLSLFGKLLGGREKGGPVGEGKPYVVGEKGWEIFVPDKPGTIIPHHESVKLANEYVSQSSIDKNKSVKEYFISRAIADTMRAVETRLHEFVTKIADYTERITNNISARVDNYTKVFSDTIRTTNNNLLERISTHTQAVDKFVRSSSSYKAFSYHFVEAIKEKLSDSQSNIRLEKFYEKNIQEKTSLYAVEKVYKSTLEHFITNFQSSISDKSLISDKNVYSSDSEKTSSIFHDAIKTSVSGFTERISTYGESISKYFQSSSTGKESFKSSDTKGSVLKDAKESVSRIAEFIKSATSDSKLISEKTSIVKSFSDKVSDWNTSINRFEQATNSGKSSIFFNDYKEKTNKILSSLYSSSADVKTHISETFSKVAESVKSVFSDHKLTSEKTSNTIQTHLKESVSDAKEFHNKQSAIASNFESISTSLKILSESIKSSLTTVFKNNTLQIESSNKTERITIDRLQKVFNIQAFAEGGAVFGPTLAILGEGFGISRSNPELVGTANQLKGIMGGAFDLNLTISGQVRHSGNDLLYAINQAMKTTLRTTGRTGL